MAATKSLGTLTIDLIAKTGGWTAGLTAAEREAQKRTRRIKNQFTQLKEEAKVLGKATAAGVLGAVTGATAALAAMTKQGTDSIVQLNNMAQQIGVTTDALTSLRYAAQQMAGVAEGQFDTAFRRMTRRVSDFATTGKGAAAAALNELRLSSQQLASLAPEDQFKLIADRMAAIDDETRRTALAFRIFGSEGQALGQAFAEGAGGIEEMQQKAAELGLVIDQIEANKVAQLDAAITEANASFNAFKQHLATEFAPVLSGIVQVTNEWSQELGGMDTVAERAFNKVIEGAGFVIDAGEGVKRVFEVVGRAIAVSMLAAEAAVYSVADVIVNGPTKAVNELIEQINRLPGIDIGAIGDSDFGRRMLESKELAVSAMQEGMSDIQEILMKPMPSENLKKWVSEVKDAADEAARTMSGAVGGASNVVQFPTGAAVQGGAGDDKQKESAARALEALRKQLRDEREVIYEDWEERQEVLFEALEQEIIDKQTHADMLEQINDEYQSQLTEMERRASDERKRIAQEEFNMRLGAAKNAFGQLSTLMNSHSRKMFEVGKMGALANVAINTADAAMGAYKALAPIPIIGPSLGAAASAAAVASGAAQAQNIKKTKFGGGGVSSGGSVTSAINDAAEPVGQQARQEIYIHTDTPDNLVRTGDLIDRINEEINGGKRLVSA